MSAPVEDDARVNAVLEKCAAQLNALSRNVQILDQVTPVRAMTIRTRASGALRAGHVRASPSCAATVHCRGSGGADGVAAQSGSREREGDLCDCAAEATVSLILLFECEPSILPSGPAQIGSDLCAPSCAGRRAVLGVHIKRILLWLSPLCEGRQVDRQVQSRRRCAAVAPAVPVEISQ